MSATNYVTYTGDGSTTTFDVTFDFLTGADLVAYVGGVDTAFTLDGDQLTFDTAPGNGDEVTIQRVTQLEDPAVTFEDDSALSAEDLNDQFAQVLWGVQDAHFRIDGLSAGGGAGGGDVPTPAAADRMLVSKSDGAGGYEYQLQTVSQLQTLLGITSPITVPTPVSGSKFLVTDASSAAYELATVAEVQSLLSVPTFNLPTLNSAPNRFLISKPDGSGVLWYAATYARDLMGLGTAALVNTGTTVGTLPLLVSGGGGSPALPAVSGENLTNVARALDYAMWDKTSSVTVAAVSGWVNLTSSITNTVASTSSWNRSAATGVELDTGTYHIRFEALDNSAGAFAMSYRIAATGGTISPTSGSVVSLAAASTGGGYQSVECVFKITSATCAVSLEADSGSNANVTKVRMHITKLA